MDEPTEGLMSDPIQMAIPGTPIPPRPKKVDEAVVEAAATDLADTLIKHDPGLTERDRIIEELTDALASMWHTDGYKLAKYMEDCHWWDPDEEIVEVLAGARHALWAAHEDAEAQWVAEHAITPKLAIGDTVTLLKSQVIHQSPDEPVTGKVRFIYANIGKYCIGFEGLGHLTDEQWEKNRLCRDGLPGGKFVVGSHGDIIDFEIAENWPTPPPTRRPA